jgi:hypothetical protein
MKTILRNILAVVAGFAAGSVVNMSLINLGPMVIPPPAGADVSTPEALKASMHLFEPKHFIMPFLAHALGTFAGALVATRIAATQPFRLALSIGALFFLGGIGAVVMIGGPMWFNVLDLTAAYFPMAYAAYRFSGKQ